MNSIATFFLLSLLAVSLAQVKINFDQKIRDWDGFGVNYVEARQKTN